MGDLRGRPGRDRPPVGIGWGERLSRRGCLNLAIEQWLIVSYRIAQHLSQRRQNEFRV
jgi:hypothetical protein